LPDPIVRPGTAQKISDHVHIIPDNNVRVVPNIGIIVGARAALVVDTGLGEPNGKTVLAEARKLAPGKALYLVSTHVHPEHDLGAGAFPADTKMLRSSDQVREIARDGLAMANRFAAFTPATGAMLKGAEFRKAAITFDKDYTLDLGGVTAKIIALGGNHTTGDTVVFVEGDRVLFSGDLAMEGLPSLMSPNPSLKRWREALDRMEALGPRIVVPSHGPQGEGTAFMQGYRKYFAAIEEATAAAKKRGETADQAEKSVSAALVPTFLGSGPRIGAAIRAAYGEAP
jgi:glyoxylase-like metal-dependent hydrolase (beta-lactamase superfamily II)